jgi:hypothetical protein
MLAEELASRSVNQTYFFINLIRCTFGLLS